MKSSRPIKKQKKVFPVFGPFEVVIHNSAHDCWLSLLDKVFDVTPLIHKYKHHQCIKPLIAFAGKDVSHWFDKRTGEIQHYVHPVTGLLVPYCPHGKIPDVSYEVPNPLWKPLHGLPWWKDGEKYQVGIMTKSVRPVRIANMLTCKIVQINVCCEDTLKRIQERYSIFNSESDSYTWVFNDVVVNMNKTLDENGIPDERECMADLGIPKSFYTPCLFLYYNDDLRHYEELDDEVDSD